MNTIERSRVEEQIHLDGQKDVAERNRLGQFATPPELALQIGCYLRELWGERSDSVHFIDPAIGTGALYSALRDSFELARIAKAAGIEVDKAFADAARSLWADTGLQVTTGDFTRQPPPPDGGRFNLVLTNPPYVRHHHLSHNDKRRLQVAVKDMLGLKISGLAGLYAYFLLLSHNWMQEDGIGVWLIPSEFMDVNYGSAVRDYLTRRVRLLQIHRFRPTDVQFCDALVTSAVVVFQKALPSVDHEARFTLGGSMLEPELEQAVSVSMLRDVRKWTCFPQQSPQSRHSDTRTSTLGQFFVIKRGIATGANGFFILPRQEALGLGIPEEAIRPILPSPRYLESNVVEREADGWPALGTQLALIDCALPEDTIRDRFPGFWAYLEKGIHKGIHKGYIAAHRSPWYSQEQRDPAPFLCNYMGRPGNGSRPFRFIWNKSEGITPNVYLLLYPKGRLKEAIKQQPDLAEKVFEALQSVNPEDLTCQGRVYGGGLYKVEPKELAAVSGSRISEHVRGIVPAFQLSLGFTEEAHASANAASDAKAV